MTFLHTVLAAGLGCGLWNMFSTFVDIVFEIFRKVLKDIIKEHRDL
jgi:hypothetical protein